MASTGPTILWDEPNLAPADWVAELEGRCRVTAVPELAKASLHQRVVQDRPDVCLLTQQTLKRIGFSFLDTCRAEVPNTGLVIMAQHRSEDAVFVREALAHGANDFVFATDAAWEMEHRVWTLAQQMRQSRLPSYRDQNPIYANEPHIKSSSCNHLHDKKTGRLNAKHVADYLGVPLKALCRGLKRGYAGVHKSPASASIQKPLHPIVKTLEHLHILIPSESDMRVWLNSPHTDLDGATPLDLILQAKAQVVSDMLEAAIQGYPS